MSNRPHPASRLFGATLSVALALTAALVVVEVGVRLSNQNALFALSIFAPDSRLGVSLRPDAATRVRRRSGAVTTVRTDPRGRRVLPAACSAGAPRFVIVGDSQALGLHVEDDETFTNLLQQRFGSRACFSLLAVPTYGPQEYRRVLAQATQDNDVVGAVVLVTMGNDWMERPIENRARTTARYGFAASTSRPNAVTWSARIAEWLAPLTPYSHFAVYAQRGRAGGATPLTGPARAIDFATHHHAAFEADRMLDVLDDTTLRVPLIVASLPLDIEVSPSHRKKYAPGAHALFAQAPQLAQYHDALLTRAQRRQVIAVDVRTALIAEGHASFLYDDDHLSPTGHRIVADVFERPLSKLLIPFPATQTVARLAPRGP